MEETIANIVMILVTLLIVFYAGTIWKRNEVQSDAQKEIDNSIENDEERKKMIEEAEEQIKLNEEILEKIIDLDEEYIEKMKEQVDHAKEVLKRAKEALYNNSNTPDDQ